MTCSMPAEHRDSEYLYHYYEKARGPFMNLSYLGIREAHSIMDALKSESNTFAARRNEGYLERRQVPHYMVVGACDWLKSWYLDGQCVKIHISEFDLSTISFSYGDLFPTFSPRVTDKREYRRNVYTYQEIVKLIMKYGLPQAWNADGRNGPERYIEVQVWDDVPLNKYGGDQP